MKLLYFSREHTTHDRRFLSAIVNRGYAAHFLALEPNRIGYDAHPLPQAVEVEQGGPLVIQARGAAESPETTLARVLDRVRPDIVMAGPIPSCAALVARCGFSPLAAVSWGSDILVDAVQDQRLRAEAILAVSAASLVVCDSAAVEREIRGMSDAAPRILRFPWGALPAWFERDEKRVREWRKSMGWEHSIVVLAARAWHHGYGVELVVEAFVRAVKEIPALHLALAGDGPAGPRIRQLIAQHGVDPSVTMLGQIAEEDVTRMCHTADMYCAATPTDGTSVTLLQALAAGLPVVVAQNEGNAEWVSNGANGFLVPAADVAGFARRMVQLAQDRPAALEMGQRGRAKVLRDANWEQNTAGMLDALAGLTRNV